jgi:hypothetical protein
MTKRTTTAVLALLPLTIGLAACQPQTGHTAGPVTGGTAKSADAPACTPTFAGGDGSGISLSHGKVTGSFFLTCNPVPTSGEVLVVSYDLAYTPASGGPTQAMPANVETTYQDTYTTGAVTCRPGTWYLSPTIGSDAVTVTGPKETITDCTQNIS